MNKFYLGKVGQSIVYILFCWTFILSLIGFIEGVVYLTMTDQAFVGKYGMSSQSTEAKPTASQPVRAPYDPQKSYSYKAGRFLSRLTTRTTSA